MRNRFLVSQFLITLALVIGAAGVGLGWNALRPDSLPLIQDWDEIMARRAEKQLPGGLTAINFERMKQIYQQKDLVIVDARPKVFFDLEHIPGARSLPLDEADQRLAEFLKNIPGSVRIITYCDGATCPAARDLAQKIAQAGYKDVAVYIGGMVEWLEKGMPRGGTGQ